MHPAGAVLVFVLSGLCGVACLVLGYHIRFEQRILSCCGVTPDAVTDLAGYTRVTGTTVIALGVSTTGVGVLTSVGGGLPVLWIAYGGSVLVLLTVYVLATYRYTR